MLKDFINYLETISNQTCKNIESILVVNVATDKLLNLAQISIKDNHFSVIYQSKTKSVSAKSIKICHTTFKALDDFPGFSEILVHLQLFNIYKTITMTNSLLELNIH